MVGIENLNINNNNNKTTTTFKPLNKTVENGKNSKKSFVSGKGVIAPYVDPNNTQFKIIAF